MKKIFITGTLMFIALFSINSFAQCGGCPAKATCEKAEAGSEVTTAGHMALISTPSVQCSMCKETLESGLNKLEGVYKTMVNVEQKITHVKYDAAKLDQAKIEQAITALGYQANDRPADAKAYAKLPDCCKKPDKF